MKKMIIYVDDFSRVELSRNTTAALSRARRAVEVLRESGLPITEDTICECISMERKEKLVPISQQPTEALGVETLKLCRTIVTFGGCPTLTKEINQKVSNAVQSRITAKEQEQAEKEVTSYFGNALTKIVGIIENGNVNYSVFLESFYLDNGAVMIDEDKKAKACIEQSTVYAESEKALKAMELHKKCADAVREFVEYMGAKYQPVRATEILAITSNGVVPTNINYNRYLN